ncbi:hypothetical protein VNO80_26948 [Phaseolus coccineus]|uniref:Uncharacterized protein n=1 Tax=Phaseolus coccineus TaxID=3886 RepID=A0AAN9LFQ1_PHACN
MRASPGRERHANIARARGMRASPGRERHAGIARARDMRASPGRERHADIARARDMRASPGRDIVFFSEDSPIDDSENVQFRLSVLDWDPSRLGQVSQVSPRFPLISVKYTRSRSRRPSLGLAHTGT